MRLPFHSFSDVLFTCRIQVQSLRSPLLVGSDSRSRHRSSPSVFLHWCSYFKYSPRRIVDSCDAPARNLRTLRLRTKFFARIHLKDNSISVFALRLSRVGGRSILRLLRSAWLQDMCPSPGKRQNLAAFFWDLFFRLSRARKGLGRRRIELFFSVLGRIKSMESLVIVRVLVSPFVSGTCSISNIAPCLVSSYLSNLLRPHQYEHVLQYCISKTILRIVFFYQL